MKQRISTSPSYKERQDWLTPVVAVIIILGIAALVWMAIIWTGVANG